MIRFIFDKFIFIIVFLILIILKLWLFILGEEVIGTLINFSKVFVVFKKVILLLIIVIYGVDMLVILNCLATN